MTKKVTTSESYKYDAEGKLLEKHVTVITEEEYPTYTPYAPYFPTSPYPYITYTNYPTSTMTTGAVSTTSYNIHLVTDDDNDGDEPQAGVNA